MQEEDNPEIEKKIQSNFKGIANQFVDPIKAEENLQKLHQMKDNNIFKALSTLLNPSTTFAQAATVRVCCSGCWFMIQSITNVWQLGSQLLLVFQLSLVRPAPLIATIALHL